MKKRCRDGGCVCCFRPSSLSCEAKIFETTEEIDELLLLTSQVLDGLEPEAYRVELEAVISESSRSTSYCYRLFSPSSDQPGSLKSL